MAYVTLEDDTGSMELLAFSRVLEESGNYLQVNLPILVYGRISVRDEKASVLTTRMTPASSGSKTCSSSSPAISRLCSTSPTPAAAWAPAASSTRLS